MILVTMTSDTQYREFHIDNKMIEDFKDDWVTAIGWLIFFSSHQVVKDI